MLSNRPYLLRAFYQWIVDSSCIPILVIDATHPRAKIPQDYAEGGEIVFNISASAVRDLKMTNEHVEFKASFSGIIHIISAPIGAILAVYAEENGEGIFFDAEEGDTTTDTGTTAESNNLKEFAPLKGIDGFSDTPFTPEMSVEKGKIKPFLKLVE